jgi:hypothetical protein
MRDALNSEYLFEYYLALFSRAEKSRKIIKGSPYQGIDALYVKLNLSQKNELLSSVEKWLLSINYASWDVKRHCIKNNQDNKVNMSDIRGPHNIQAWMIREKNKLDGLDTMKDDINIFKFIEKCNVDGVVVNLDMLTDAINRDKGIETDEFIMYKWSQPNDAGVRTIIPY